MAPLEASEGKHIARVCLSARRAAEKERHCPVCDCVLRQIVIDYQDISAALHELLCDRAAGVRRYVLQGRAFARISCHDHGVVHRSKLLEGGNHLRYGRSLLPDSYVHADDISTLLVDDRVNRDRGFSGLAVTDDQLALPLAKRNQSIDHLDPGQGSETLAR